MAGLLWRKEPFRQGETEVIREIDPRPATRHLLKSTMAAAYHQPAREGIDPEPAPVVPDEGIVPIRVITRPKP